VRYKRRRRPSLKSRAKKLLGWVCIVAAVVVNIQAGTLWFLWQAATALVGGLR
jgi:hypothetical protein